LPKQAKTSEGVEQALAEITQSSKKHIKPRARELGEEESKGKSPSPLDDLVHYTKGASKTGSTFSCVGSGSLRHKCSNIISAIPSINELPVSYNKVPDLAMDPPHL